MIWLKVFGAGVGVLALAVVAGAMMLSMLPSPTARELLKRWAAWRRSRRR